MRFALPLATLMGLQQGTLATGKGSRRAAAHEKAVAGWHASGAWTDVRLGAIELRQGVSGAEWRHATQSPHPAHP